MSRASTAGFTYRPYLDGLRALAVTSVIAYHLDAPWMRGGFLGVDVFFVLSGYLITSLLVTEYQATGTISIVGFWARRVRRLFPALLMVLVAVAAGVKLLRPQPQWPLAQADLTWTALYAANWHQIITSRDYFADFVAASPLRHMWSIAIEEQFYLLWPLTVWCAFRWAPRQVVRLVWIGIGLSFARQWWLFDPGNPTRAYVGTDSRAHELLFGAALAFLSLSRRSREADDAPSSRLQTAATVLSPLAALTLVTLMVALPDTSPHYYRGGSLLVSLLATVLVWSLETAPSGLPARWLGAAPVAAIGRISYGLYLWHWPVIAFLPTAMVLTFGVPGMQWSSRRDTFALLTVVVTVTLSTVMYVLIERPIRYGRALVLSRPPLLAAWTLACTALFLSSIVSLLKVPDELHGQVRTASDCALPACLVVNSGPNRPVIAVMGDSIAMSMGPAFEDLARQFHWTFVSGAHNRCTVLEHMLAVPNWDECFASVPLTRAAILEHRPAIIVVSDNWMWVDAIGANGAVLKSASPDHVAHVEAILRAAVEPLARSGALVVLMHLVPSGQIIECADETFSRNAGPRCAAPDRDQKFDLYNAVIDRVAAENPQRVLVLDLTDALCPNGTCYARIDGRIIRFDSMHFSTDGARWLSPFLARKLRAAGVRLDL